MLILPDSRIVFNPSITLAETLTGIIIPSRHTLSFDNGDNAVYTAAAVEDTLLLHVVDMNVHILLLSSGLWTGLPHYWPGGQPSAIYLYDNLPVEKVSISSAGGFMATPAAISDSLEKNVMVVPDLYFRITLNIVSRMLCFLLISVFATIG